MGTISRFRHVVSANVNALLERAEDPEKMLGALVREMEDALGEAREAAAGLIRDRKRFERRIVELKEQQAEWEERAEHALSRDREDLARAAIASKARLAEEQRQCQFALSQATDSVSRVDQDVAHLESRLSEARRRQQQMRQAPAAAARKPAAYYSPADRKLADVMTRFERLESQIDQLEARVESFDLGGAAPSAAEPDDPQVEEELNRLRSRLAGASTESS